MKGSEFRDIALEIPGKKLSTKNRKEYQPSFFNAISENSNAFFPGCYPLDTITHTVSISIATDYGFWLRVNAANPTASEEIQRLNVLNKIQETVGMIRPLYLAQLNVQLQVDKIVVGTARDVTDPILYQSPNRGCPVDAQLTLYKFSSWVRTRKSPSAHWSLLTDCHPSPGTVGASYIGSLCEKTFGINAAISSWTEDSLWLILAHEIGHSFGAKHTTFGIMGSGDGKYDGIVQFHPNNRNQMCNEIKEVISTNCPFINYVDSGSNCGNMIFEPKEECECLDGSQSCGPCISCKLQSPVQCSTQSDGFVVRNSETPSFAQITSALHSDSKCCVNNVLAPLKTICSNGFDACSTKSGKCIRTCGKYGLQSCGFDETRGGCVQNCIFNSICQGATLVTVGPPPIPVGALPDGSDCNLNGVPGTCLVGVCKGLTRSNSPSISPTKETVLSTGTPTDPVIFTKVPTNLPTSNSPTTKSPSVLRTGSPALETGSPTNIQTNTPTNVQTTPVPTMPETRTPTNDPSCPPEEYFVSCPQKKTALDCKSSGCVWCPNSQKSANCQASQLACNTPVSKMNDVFAQCEPFLSSNRGRR